MPYDHYQEKPGFLATDANPVPGPGERSEERPALECRPNDQTANLRLGGNAAALAVAPSSDAVTLVRVDLDSPATAAGAWIGPYQLLHKLGEGGMGAVWLAQQTHPVKRKVALKFTKGDLDSAVVVARFAAELQALALMDHPHIVKEIDAGTTDAGRTY